MSAALLPTEGVLIGRARMPGSAYPRIVTVRGGRVLDITSSDAPTVRDICEMPGGVDYVARAPGIDIGAAEALLANSWAAKQNLNAPSLLSPIDLQAVKAAGVTFVVSLLERVIEEQARGDKARADTLRAEIVSP